MYQHSSITFIWSTYSRACGSYHDFFDINLVVLYTKDSSKNPPPPNLPGFYQKCLLFTTFLFFFQVDWNLLWISNGHYCYTLRKLIEVCRKCQIMTRWINLWLILLGKHKWFESKVKDFLIPISVLDTTLCDKVCQWLAAGRLFSPGTPVSSSNNTDRHDILKYCWKWR
jgi:hypothetical protein